MTADELVALAMSIDAAKDRIIVESMDGAQWVITSAKVYGARTDDPALVVRVR